MNKFFTIVFVIIMLSGCFSDDSNTKKLIPPLAAPLFTGEKCLNWEDPNIQGIVSVEEAFNGKIFERIIDLETYSGIYYLASRSGLISRTDETGSEVLPLIDLSAYIGSANNDNSQQWGITSISLSDDYYSTKKLFVAMNGKMAGDSKVTSRILLMNLTPDYLDVDRDSIKVVIREQQTTPWHHLGQIQYHTDGKLFAGFGDGGQEVNASNLNTVKGKVLRLQISEELVTSVPADNPIIDGKQSYIYAYGVRNPWRFSIDRVTNKLWLGDVGRLDREEINIIEAGKNYGWPTLEGSMCRAESCESFISEAPFYEYTHDQGVAAIGGFVYRGDAIPSLVGTYIYRDVLGTKISYLTKDEENKIISKLLANPGIKSISSFAEDEYGEIYLLNPNGNYAINKIVPLKDEDEINFEIPETLSETGCVNMDNPKEAGEGGLPYNVNSKLWSDGAVKYRSFKIDPDTEISINDEGKFVYSPGAILVKTFIKDLKVIETRLLVKHLQGHWSGYSYEWNEKGTEAHLLADKKTVQLDSGQWDFPSREQCFSCHTDTENTNLGIEVNQVLPDGISKEHLNGLVSYIPEGLPTATPMYSIDANVDDEVKVRSYLHSNCSGCHNPNTTTPTKIDFRYSTPFEEMNICNAIEEHPLNNETVLNIIEPGDKNNSSLYKRVNMLGDGQMPPLGRNQIDIDAVNLIGNWINNRMSCD